MTAFMRDSFSVPSPGTEDYRKKYESIFECKHGNKKSKCEDQECVTLRNAEANGVSVETQNGIESHFAAEQAFNTEEK